MYIHASTSIKPKVANYITNGQWNISTLSKQLPYHSLRITIHSPSLDDQPIWTASIDRRFSSNSAWNFIRNKHNLSEINNMIWPFSIWKVLRYKIVVDSNRGIFNLGKAPKCDCSIVSALKDEEHLFMNSLIGKLLINISTKILVVE